MKSQLIQSEKVEKKIIGERESDISSSYYCYDNASSILLDQLLGEEYIETCSTMLL
jgi:hypothetical protein